MSSACFPQSLTFPGTKFIMKKYSRPRKAAAKLSGKEAPFMILTVTLNPCIDRTVYLDRLTVGSYNRVQSTRSDPAGKGLNVSIVLKNLNEDTLCTGIKKWVTTICDFY